MISIFLFGFLTGLRHALEGDHLGAVASLATRSHSLRSGVWQGVAWGLGHTITLLLVGGTCLLLGQAVPERWAKGLELVVGLMLLALGIDVLRRVRLTRVHVHVHRHEDGTSHLHVHRHDVESVHDPTRHEHPHLDQLPLRALAVGLVHGMAGSAAVFLLTLQAVPSIGLGLAYIAMFGLGSILGMAALSLAIVVPMRAAAHAVGRLQTALELIVGLTTIAIGMNLVYRILS